MAVQSADGQIKSTAAMSIVTDYDLAVRKNVADLMNDGIDSDSAMKAARGNDRLMMLNFLSPIAISVAEKGRLAFSAQDICQLGGPAAGSKCPGAVARKGTGQLALSFPTA